MGQDRAADELKTLLSKGGVSVEGVVAVDRTFTTVKTRIIAEHQQVVRVDWDNDPVFDDVTMDRLCEQVAVAAAKATGVVIEDYGKGVVQQRIVDTVLRVAREKGIPAGLDPKDNHDLELEGITVITPNRREAHVAVGWAEKPAAPDPAEDARLQQVSHELREKWKPEMLLITLGPQGMVLVSEEASFRYIPTRAREVYDVSGAGDTVIAVCLLALAAGATRVEAAELANYAAGVVVGKLGTATCSQEELMNRFLHDASWDSALGPKPGIRDVRMNPRTGS
jgi:D-beta-D-heptose 7-phosphate kinase/D-beta-D-heptose 1-phosphate adenosyltransferase